jgi:predicted amidophosphoribosyltransferase
MLCLSCREPCRVVLCDRCGRSLRPAPDRVLPGGLVVRAAFEHSGAARSVVHRLKYEGIVEAAEWLASVLGPRLPEAGCLVPVPRTMVRRVRYGADPAVLLASALRRVIGIPVVEALTPPFASPRHAGRGRGERPPPRFALRRRVVAALLIDDVLTTGSTLASAERAIGAAAVAGAVVATAAPGRASSVRWLPAGGEITEGR